MGVIIPLLEQKATIRVNDVVHYILKRQNEDGGYTFCQGTESSAQDTYYATEILRMLDAKPRNMDKTSLFLQGLQRQDGDFDSVKVAYYVITTLSYLGAKPAKPIDRFVRSFETLIEEAENTEVYVDVTSEVENIYFATKILNMLNFPMDHDRIIKQILGLQNRDGSFGRAGYSKLASTYYSLKTLSLLNYDARKLEKTLRWVKRCEAPSGGFLAAPELSPTYIVIEDIYFGVKSLEALDETCRYSKETLDLIAKFQNPNGGFRRSIFLGISDFESTYQALSAMETILKSMP